MTTTTPNNINSTLNRYKKATTTRMVAKIAPNI